MQVCFRPMQAKDVKPCAGLLASHPEERHRYGELLAQLPAAWLSLLRTGAMLSSVFEDKDAPVPRLIGCGVSVFVTDGFLRRLKTKPLVWVGPELLRRVIAGNAPILGPKEIRQANSRDGLNNVVWAGIGCTSRAEDWNQLVMEVIRAYFQTHAGYQLKEVVLQPNDLQIVRIMINVGTLFWLESAGDYVDGRHLEIEKLVQAPFILGSNRELAIRNLGSWDSNLFSHSPPRIYFRPAEQRLLLAALRGLTDEELSDELSVSLSAVKKTWRVIYERAAEMLSDLRPPTGDLNSEKRGREKKQHLLAYLRQHMEELRPVLPP